MSSDDATGVDESRSTDTPLFDATAQALAAGEAACGATSASDNTDAPGPAVHASVPADDGAAARDDWVSQRYDDPSTPTPLIDPDTPEGAAILWLLGKLQDVAHGDPHRRGCDIVAALNDGFADLGISPGEHPRDAGRRLRLALRDRFGGRSVSSIYGVRIGTDHDDPDLIIRTALHVLVRQLGPGTSIDLVSQDREVVARIEHHTVPTTGS